MPQAVIIDEIGTEEEASLLYFSPFLACMLVAIFRSALSPLQRANNRQVPPRVARGAGEKVELD